MCTTTESFKLLRLKSANGCTWVVIRRHGSPRLDELLIECPMKSKVWRAVYIVTGLTVPATLTELNSPCESLFVHHILPRALSINEPAGVFTCCHL